MDALLCYESPPAAATTVTTDDQSSPEDFLQPAFPDEDCDENIDENIDEDCNPADPEPVLKKPRKIWELVGTFSTDAELEACKASLLCGSRKWTRSLHHSSNLASSAEVLKCIEVRKCHCPALIKVYCEGGKYFVYRSELWHDHSSYFGVGLSHEQKAIIDPLLKSRQAQPKVIERALRDAGLAVDESQVGISIFVLNVLFLNCCCVAES